MTQTNDPIEQMHELLAALREGELTADQSQQLQTLVIEDEAARKLYVQSMQLHADLRWQCDAAVPPLPAEVVSAAQQQNVSNRERIEAMTNPTLNVRTPIWMPLATIAALLIAAVTLALGIMAINELTGAGDPRSTNAGNVAKVSDNATDGGTTPNVAANQPPAPEPTKEPTAEDLVRAKLAEPISVDFKDEEFEKVIDHLRDVTGLNLFVNMAALEAAGIAPDTSISVQAKEIPIEDVMRLVLTQASVGSFEPIKFGIRGNLVKVTTGSDLAADIEPRFHDVRDLLTFRWAKAHQSYRAPAFGLQNALDSGTRSGRDGREIQKGGPPSPPAKRHRVPMAGDLAGGAIAGDTNLQTRRQIASAPIPSKRRSKSSTAGLFGDADDDDGDSEEWSRTERSDEIITLIRETITPEDWQFHGGESATIRESFGQLWVHAAPETHREIEQLLGQLRGVIDTDPPGFDPDQLADPMRPAVGVPPIEPPVPDESTANRETYDYIVDNPFLESMLNPLSTFSIDVDTASYANTRRMLQQGSLPPLGAVRVEEFINYFPYDDDIEPQGDAPFGANVEIAACPWNEGHQLARVAIKGKEIEGERKPANLVFLIDVSGSMNQPNKLPLLKDAFKKLTNELADDDRVAIVVYASASGLVLESTEGKEKQAILEAIDNLQAGGSTNGGEGIRLAYRTAREHFIDEGINRVILATDGDFNVGTTSDEELVKLIEKERESDVFLSVLSFGDGNLQDAKMEKLADHGNGNYSYIDSAKEAEKVLIEQMEGTLITIAKDVKIQIEFNPNKVASYRLIGYENRMLEAKDFNDDTKDAGEIGAGHTVTALYELVTVEQQMAKRAQMLKLLETRIRHAKEEIELLDEDSEEYKERSAILKRLEEQRKAFSRDEDESTEIDPLKYQKLRDLTDAADSDEWLTLKLRYRQPEGDLSTKIELPVTGPKDLAAKGSEDFRFAGAAAAFGMILRDSPHKGEADFDMVIDLASNALGKDAGGYRREFVELTKKAKAIAGADVDNRD